MKLYKEQLDRIEDMLGQIKSQQFDFDKIDKRDAQLAMVEMFDAIIDGRKIDAIKAYRTITAAPLKASKDEIERLYDRINNQRIDKPY